MAKTYDWRNFIIINESVSPEMRENITKVLDDMASDPNGIKILKRAEKHSGTINIINEDSLELNGQNGEIEIREGSCYLPKEIFNSDYNTINISSLDLTNAFFVDKKTATVFPISLNNLLAHELVHAGDTLATKPQRLKDKNDLLQDKIDVEEDKDSPSKLKLFFLGLKEDLIDKRIKNTEIKYFKKGHQIENDACELADQYLRKFDEPQRSAYMISLLDRYCHDMIVITGNDKFSDHWHGNKKASLPDVLDLKDALLAATKSQKEMLGEITKTTPKRAEYLADIKSNTILFEQAIKDINIISQMADIELAPIKHIREVSSDGLKSPQQIVVPEAFRKPGVEIK